MDCILCDEIRQWADDKAHISKNKESEQPNQRKEWVHLVLDKGDDFTIAVFASNFYRTKKQKMNKFENGCGHLLDVVNDLIGFFLYLFLLLFSSINTGNSITRFFGIIVHNT